MLRVSISSHCSKYILLVQLTAWLTRNAGNHNIPKGKGKKQLKRKISKKL